MMSETSMRPLKSEGAAQSRIVIIGGGGHASDVLNALEERAFVAAAAKDYDVEIVGLVADGSIDMGRFAGRGVTQIGSIDGLGELGATHFVSAVGYPEGRRAVTERALRAGLKPCRPIVHPSAIVAEGVALGPGSVVLAGACISRGVVTGAHICIGALAIVGHDCRMGDFATVMPGAAISGDTDLAEGCMVGANATVIEKCRIGPWSEIGAGAVVTKDLPAGVTAKGVPARWETTSAE